MNLIKSQKNELNKFFNAKNAKLFPYFKKMQLFCNFVPKFNKMGEFLENIRFFDFDLDISNRV